MDSNRQRQWLEDACASLFPPECAFAIRDYGRDEIHLPAPEDAALAHAVPKRKMEFAAGRVAAQAALLKLGAASGIIPVGPDRAPLWPEEITGSITHTAGFAIAVVARRREIAALGIDLEIADAVNPGLWKGVLTETEIRRLSALPAERRNRLATAIFSAKESFYKLQHPLTGLWLDFHDAEVEVAPDSARFQLTCHETRAVARLGRSEFAGRCAPGEKFVLTALHLPGAAKPI